MLKPLLRPVLRPILSVINKVMRAVYNFDGIDDRATMQFRAINPDGDIDIEWTQTSLPASGTRDIISQCDSSTIASREFMLRWDEGFLDFAVGGSFILGQPQGVAQAVGTWRVFYSGTTVQVFLNGTMVYTFTGRFRGSAREPAAQTRIGVRNNAGSIVGYWVGALYDVRINGVLWPIGDRNQSIQLPNPSGLGAELITPSVHAAPSAKGTQWTHLGGGRWQYVGDGSFNELVFINHAQQPQAYVLEFEIESISGAMRCNATTSQIGVFQSNPTFTTPGVYRHVVTSRQGLAMGSGSYANLVRNYAGQPASCIIKNISMRPLISAYGSELVTNGNFASATGWAVGAGAVITNGELQINSATIVSAVRPVATVNGRIYEVTFTVKSISSGSVRAILYGSGMQYVGPNRNAAGTYTELVQFNALGGSFNNSVSIQGAHASSTVAVIDDVSVREVLGFCNPMVTSNFNPDRWSDIL